jgi:hypothetical protein
MEMGGSEVLQGDEEPEQREKGPARNEKSQVSSEEWICNMHMYFLADEVVKLSIDNQGCVSPRHAPEQLLQLREQNDSNVSRKHNYGKDSQRYQICPTLEIPAARLESFKSVNKLQLNPASGQEGCAWPWRRHWFWSRDMRRNLCLEFRHHFQFWRK